jgi:hypothetical protein
MQTELETIKNKFAAAGSTLADLFRTVLGSQTELYDKGKQDAYVELLAFCHKHSDAEGRVDKTKVQAFLEEKIIEYQLKSKETK